MSHPPFHHQSSHFCIVLDLWLFSFIILRIHLTNILNEQTKLSLSCLTTKRECLFDSITVSLLLVNPLCLRNFYWAFFSFWQWLLLSFTFVCLVWHKHPVGLLISYQTTVFFFQNKPATNTFLSKLISTSHQPPPKRTDWPTISRHPNEQTEETDWQFSHIWGKKNW